MSLLHVLLALLIVGVVLALLPMDGQIRRVVVVLAVVVALVAVIRYLGVL